MLRSAQLREAIQDSSHRLGIARRYDLGVLLVHGLGEQARGDTLTVQGDPIIAWLRGRVGSTGKPGDAKVDVLDVVARQQSGDAIPNPHAVIRITPPASREPPFSVGEPVYWVVAEAYWAENFRQATFTEFIGWLMTIGPWVFATQVAGIIRRMEIGQGVPRLLRIGLIAISAVAGLAFLLGAAAAGFLMSVAAAAVLFGAYVPISFVAEAARSFQRTLANGFGDAYVLSRSPVRFGAMAAEVRAGLEVLRQESNAVAVIAESQGTAVAWYGLKHEIVDRRPDIDDAGIRRAPIGLFLTHAQGLRKLAFALAMARGAQTGGQTLAALASAVILAAALVALLAGYPWFAALAFVLAVVAELILMRSANRVWDEAGTDIENDWKAVLEAEANEPRTPEAPRLEWLDLWASADPGSVGPLGVAGERINSFKIRNVGSAWADHVAYWRNTTEFLPIVMSFLFRLGGPRAYALPLDDPHLEVPAMRRHARVLALIPFRAVVGFGVALGLLHAWLTPDFGAGILAFVGSLNLLLVDGFFDSPPDWAVALAGYLSVLAAGVILWLPVITFWNGLLGRDEKTFFRGTRRPLWTPSWYAFGALLVLIGAVVVALLLLVDEPILAGTYVIGAIGLALLGLVVLAGGGRTFGSDEVPERPTVATRKITGGRASSLAITATLAAVIVIVPLLAAFLVPDAFLAVLAVETLLMSAVLVAEGVREYGVFRARFGALNDRLPEDVEPPRG